MARTRTAQRRHAVLSALLISAVLAPACGSDAPSPAAPAFTADIRAAAAAVDEALGGPQQFFEITAGPQLTNVFVAVDGASAAVPYVYAGGELSEPAPRLAGAAGSTFSAAAIAFDEERILRGVQTELPDATIDALSVEGGPDGTVRYVVAARSSKGGALDVEVGPDGTVLAVDLL